ncbi:MAG: hypothetical protein LBK94_09840 [Prevotellaceae bacterium]|jgi:hypothetical protein|nr:hypothetical protein [Prevotellaceae bacterium]
MKSLKYILAIVITTLLFTSCEDEKKYLGSPYVKFSSYSGVFEVIPDGVSTYDIEVQLVGAPLSEDITLTVNVLSDLSDARSGTDYSMSYEVKIPAGKNLATFTVTGYYDGLDDGTQDERTLVLELVGTSGAPAVKTPISTSNPMGVNTYELTLRGFCPLVMQDFTGTGVCLVDEGFSNPGETYPVELTVKDATSLNFLGIFYCAPGEPGYPMTLSFDIGSDGRGTISLLASDIWKTDVGLGVDVMLHVCGGNVNKPIPVSYDACERTLTIVYNLRINDPIAGSYNGYDFGTYTAIVQMD